MTVINMSQHRNLPVFEGDYAGNLSAEMPNGSARGIVSPIDAALINQSDPRAPRARVMPTPKGGGGTMATLGGLGEVNKVVLVGGAALAALLALGYFIGGK